MTVYSLDTDTVTKLLKKHPGNERVVDRFRGELKRNSLFIICPIVFFELRRELVLKRAKVQLSAFDDFVDAMKWGEFSPPVWRRASDLWSALRGGGQPHQDADVLIAAHALEYGATIVTSNVRHFQFTGASVEDWNASL